MSAKSNFTNPVLLPEQNAAILCNKTDLLIIETSSGKVLRQAKTNLDENPITLRRIGKEFVPATRPHASTLFNISGERFSDEPIIETTFPPVSFAVSQPFPPLARGKFTRTSAINSKQIGIASTTHQLLRSSSRRCSNRPLELRRTTATTRAPQDCQTREQFCLACPTTCPLGRCLLRLFRLLNWDIFWAVFYPTPPARAIP
jgi:hypothetical protein